MLGMLKQIVMVFVVAISVVAIALTIAHLSPRQPCTSQEARQ